MCFGRDQAHCWIHMVLFCLLVIFRSLPSKSIFCTNGCQVTISLLLSYENRSKVCALELGITHKWITSSFQLAHTNVV